MQICYKLEKKIYFILFFKFLMDPVSNRFTLKIKKKGCPFFSFVDKKKKKIGADHFKWRVV